MTVRAVSNDLTALRKLCNGEALKARMLRSASGEALALVMKGFQSGTDPKDDPWAPLRSRNGMILVRTARMRNSFTSKPTATGFVIGSNVTYTKFHQDGTKKMKARQMVPTGGVLTAKWQTAIDAACNVAMQNAVAEAGGK
jgi:phage gpG-like protein